MLTAICTRRTREGMDVTLTGILGEGTTTAVSMAAAAQRCQAAGGCVAQLED